MIEVTQCDNELILIASTPAGSSTLCHLKSGYNAPVRYQVDPSHILPAGHYTLEMIGINWGGPGAWEVIVNGESFGHSTGETFWTAETTIDV